MLDFLYLGGTTFPKKILSQVYEASKILKIKSLSTLVSPHSLQAAVLLSKQGEKRKREEEEELEHQERLLDFFGDSDCDESQDFDESQMDKEYFGLSRNKTPLTATAYAATRYNASDACAAAIATATLIDNGVISKSDISKTVTPAKIYRAKAKVGSNELEKRDNFCKSGAINCLFFDGKINYCIVEQEKNGMKSRGKGTKDHYALVTHPPGKGRFIGHFEHKVDTVRRTAGVKPGRQLAENFLSKLTDHGVNLDNILALGFDSTNYNTGHEGGVMSWIEYILGRRLVWIVCLLHLNELPLRHLIKSYVGESKSATVLPGPIGKLIAQAHELQLDENFTPIGGEPSFSVPETVLSELSTDQAYLYRVCYMVKTGRHDNYVLNGIGEHNRARWLCTASRLCKALISKHGLNAEDSAKLRVLVTFVVDVYVPMWFQIRLKPHWTFGPIHFLNLLKMLRQQPADVLNIIKHCVIGGAYWAHPESVLQTMLVHGDNAERTEAVEVIIKLRMASGNPAIGNFGYRNRKLTKNANILEAKSLHDLLSCYDLLSEPPLTVNIPTSDLAKYRTRKMEEVLAPAYDWPSHSQQTERYIQQLSKASAHSSKEKGIDSIVLVQDHVRSHVKSSKPTKVEQANMLDL